MPSQSVARERNSEPSTVDRCTSTNNAMRSSASSFASGLVGVGRISLGTGAGYAGLATQLEQGYHQAREAVRSNNGIKVLLQLLQTHVVMPPATLDCLCALSCWVLLDLARDDTITHILMKLQVSKKLAELIRDVTWISSQISGTEQKRWQKEPTQAAIELISLFLSKDCHEFGPFKHAGCHLPMMLLPPTLRRIERAAIAAATPITYHSRGLLLLIHEHLQACGLSSSAATLLKGGSVDSFAVLVSAIISCLSTLCSRDSIHTKSMAIW